MFGIRLPINFNAPYRATSITEFWRRWHVTLGRFLRDYLYFPLGGNRVAPARQFVNLFLVMLLGGLWHGAAWTFVIWGALHGLALAGHRLWVRLFGPPSDRYVWRGIAWAATFLFVVVTWVLFRAESLPAAGRVLGAMAGMSDASPAEPVEAWVWVGIGLGLLWVLIMPTSHDLMRYAMRHRLYVDYLKVPASRWWPVWRPSPGWVAVSALTFAAAFLGLSRITEFLYYQF
jgi:hypothetical protein